MNNLIKIPEMEYYIDSQSFQVYNKWMKPIAQKNNTVKLYYKGKTKTFNIIELCLKAGIKFATFNCIGCEKLRITRNIEFLSFRDENSYRSYLLYNIMVETEHIEILVHSKSDKQIIRNYSARFMEYPDYTSDLPGDTGYAKFKNLRDKYEWWVLRQNLIQRYL